MKYILPLALTTLMPLYAADLTAEEQKEKKDRLETYQFMLAQPTSEFYAEIPTVQEVNDSRRDSVVVVDNKENPQASPPMDLFAQKAANASPEFGEVVVEIPSAVNLHTPTDQIVSNVLANGLHDRPTLAAPTRSNPNPSSSPLHLPNCEQQ